ncbi:hypothetical protein [Ferrovibrio sp.]|uniref:hypothetical protein n=1 Tax=Ferrovibrio sp. TaxID=1917215 RepID=UPI00351345C7
MDVSIKHQFRKAEFFFGESASVRLRGRRDFPLMPSLTRIGLGFQLALAERINGLPKLSDGRPDKRAKLLDWSEAAGTRDGMID